jgi:hypothetical protein
MFQEPPIRHIAASLSGKSKPRAQAMSFWDSQPRTDPNLAPASTELELGSHRKDPNAQLDHQWSTQRLGQPGGSGGRWQQSLYAQIMA